MPRFGARVLIMVRLLYFVHGVEVEIRGELVDSLHLLLSRHSQPLLHVQTKVPALFLQSHLGPLRWVEALRAWWVVTLRCHFRFAAPPRARRIQESVADAIVDGA